MKAKIAYILTTTALVMSAFFIGKTTHQPSIPVDDVAAYYIDSNGNLNLEMKDVRCIELSGRARCARYHGSNGE